MNLNELTTLLVLSMYPVLATAATELFHLQAARSVLFVLGRHVITLFALGALQNYVISWHYFPVLSPAFRRP